jgi:hypothetical protein
MTIDFSTEMEPGHWPTKFIGKTFLEYNGSKIKAIISIDSSHIEISRLSFDSISYNFSKIWDNVKSYAQPVIENYLSRSHEIYIYPSSTIGHLDDLIRIEVPLSPISHNPDWSIVLCPYTMLGKHYNFIFVKLKGFHVDENNSRICGGTLGSLI